MFASYTATNVYVYGDIHGAFNIKCLFGLDIKMLPRRSILIQLGDFGLGFKDEALEEHTLYELNELLIDRDIKLLVVRGNHDSPQRFKQYNYTRFSNINFLDDYTYLTINKYVYGFIGGAASIDRYNRTPGKDYWEDELFILDTNKAQRCDVLCTHTGPLYVGPSDKSSIRYYLKNDKYLWEACKKERVGVEELIKLCKPTLHYCGHFHCNDCIQMHECLSRVVNIEEILPVNEYSLQVKN